VAGPGRGPAKLTADAVPPRAVLTVAGPGRGPTKLTADAVPPRAVLPFVTEPLTPRRHGRLERRS